MNILLSVYACSPYHGSEPGMGWQFVEHLSIDHKLHVIVEQEKWEKHINDELNLRPELRKNIKFYFIKKRRNRLLRKIWPPSYYYFYRKWQKEAYQLALKINEKEKIDIIHQLNMVGFREPGYLWKINKPYVWGPIGGMENVPWVMLSSMGLYGMVYHFVRNYINIFHINFLNRPFKAASRSNNKVIAATPFNSSKIKEKWRKDSTIITEVGLFTTKHNLPKLKYRSENSPLKIVWSGQHTPSKALNLLLIALSKTNKVNYTLDVLGVGTQTEKWEKLGIKLDINNKINWHGWLERDDAIQVMSNGHVFVITSLKDLTASVTLEALSLGLPIICLDHCGFSYVVNDSCGLKITIIEPKQVTNDIAKALEFLYFNEDVRFNLAEGAISRANDFAWDLKVEQLEDIYKKLLEE